MFSSNSINQLLSLTFKYVDENVKSDQYLEEDLSWIYSRIKSINLIKKLTKYLIKELNLDLLNRFKETLTIKKLFFP